MTNWVELVMEEIVAPFGMPVPLTFIPGCRLAVLATVTVPLPLVVEPPVRLCVTAATSPTVLPHVTVALALVVEQLVSVMPPASSVSADPAPVAAALMTNVVVFVTEPTVAPAGTLGPYKIMPGHRPVVLAQVTLVPPFVVVQEASVIGAV